MKFFPEGKLSLVRSGTSRNFGIPTRIVVAVIATFSVVFSSLTVVGFAQAVTITDTTCSATVGSNTGTIIKKSGSNCYVVFTQTGTNSFTVPTGVTSADIILIAGGGAGGSGAWGGGGGAGEVAIYTGYSVSNSSAVSINVGSGGAAGTATLDPTLNRSSNGTDSWVGSSSGVVAKGGGAGASYGYGSAISYTSGYAGGSGGGGSENQSVSPGGSSTASSSGSKIGYGNAGGSGPVGGQGSGGGGGSGAAGADGSSHVGGNGGAGTNTFSTWISDISSSMPSEWQTATSTGRIAAGGGGGSNGGTASTGGNGGGGAGGYSGYLYGWAAVANTGSGGGGSSFFNTLSVGTGGAGASGLVIVRFAALTASGNVGSGACAQVVDIPGTVEVTRTGTAQADCVVKFTSGTNKWLVPANVTQIKVLAIAGGGAGGGGIGGGGGAGELYSSSAHNVTPGDEKMIVIGQGGGINPFSGSTGGNTTFDFFTLYGGGGGGTNSANPPAMPGSPDNGANRWGSAGGGGYENTAIWTTTNRSHLFYGWSYRGYGGVGSNGGGPTATAGGGGGAGGDGVSGTSSNGGNGGAGRSSDITGTTLYYAGGGGGGVNGNPGNTCACTTSGNPGSGGSNVGGAAATKDSNGDGTFGDPGVGQAGLANTGSGGGGGSNSAAGAGASGVVILRYSVSYYTVTYNYNSATGGNGTASATYVSGDTGITLPTPTKTGYTFAGWYEDSTFATGSSLTGTYTTTQSRTLYAKWTADSNTVTFKSNFVGGAADTTQSITTGTATSLTANSFTRTGYTFNGWATASNGTGTSYTNSQSVTLTSGLTLYAKWSAANNTVTFKSNFSGGAADTTQTIVTDVATSLTSNAFTRTGYTFGGWATAADGSGTSYTNSQSVTLNAGLTLYAQWTAGNNTVTFGNNGGTGTMANQLITSGLTTALVTNTFVRQGYMFSTWNTIAIGGGNSYNDGQSVTITGPLNLYAQWTAGTNTVAFDNNGGTGTMANQSITSDQATALTANTFTRTGYTFAGWATSASGSVVYANSAIVTITDNLSLYAKWTANNNTVTFKANYTGGGTDTTQTIVSGTATPLTANRFTRNGYKFTGWATASDGSGTNYSNSQNVTLTSSETLFAQWSPVTTLGSGPCAQSVENLTGSVTQQGNYCLVAIKSGSSGNWIVPSGVSSISYLVVGGGGGGGNFGGGGAGSFLEVLNTSVSAGSALSATVGSGGSGGTATTTGSNGGTSSFGSTSAPGGGGGGTLNNTTQIAPRATNGSGGGAVAAMSGANGTVTSGAVSGNGTGRQNNGGSARVSITQGTYYYAAGGGGGAGAPGQASSFVSDGSAPVSGTYLGSGLYGGDGGIGYVSSLLNEASAAALSIGHADPSSTQDSVYFAGGGGGGINNRGIGFTPSYYGSGGLGGGGRGVSGTSSIALANTGGGGGGGRSISGVSSAGGTGGSGVILISFQLPGISSLTAVPKANSTTEMNLSWLEPSVSSSITGYLIEKSVAGANSWSSATTTPDLSSSTGSSTVVSGLTQGTSYDFRVIPIFETGSGATVSSTANTISDTQTITYKSNFSGGAADSTQTVNSFVSTALTSNTFTRTGYSFAGWNTAANGSGNNYSNGQSVTLTGGLTLYAKWTANNNTVTFKANYTGGPSDTTQTIVTDSATALTSNAFTRTGYSFAGWNTAANGSGDDYTNGQSVTLTGGLTLYAKWTANNNTVTFKANYTGGPSDTTQTIVTDSATALTTNSFTRTGYTFAGWNTAANGSGNNYSNGQSVTLTGGLTLYAKWTEVTYAITYNTNGATGSPERSADTYTYTGGALTLPRIASMAKTGYTFGGWSETANGSAISGTYTPSADKTLYAVWTATTYSITYNSNSPTSGSPSVTSGSYTTGGTAITLATAGTMVKTGYTFNGWSTTINDASTKILNSGSYTITAPVILYALWTPNSYSVSYSTQNSTSGTAPTDATVYNISNIAAVKANTGNLSRPGYTFAGWKINSDGTGTLYTSGDSFQIGAANVTFYPQWTANTYNVTYNVNGATGAPARTADTYTTGDPALALPGRGTMVKTGYAFTGWSTSPTGIGQVTATTLTDVVYYAIWDINTYMYSYYYGVIDGTALSNAQVATFPTGGSALYNASYTLARTNPVEVSPTVTVGGNLYQFFGWNDTATTYNAGTSLVMGNSDKSYTAQWIRLYAVRYSLNGGSGIVTVDEQCTQTDSTCTPNQVIQLSNAPTKTGYIFAGWKDQTGTSYAAGDSFTVTNTSYLLYAQWTAIDYSISFDSDGGSNSTAPSIKNISQTVTFPSPGTKNGYYFNGWIRSDIGSSPTYGVGTEYVVGSANASFIASWTPHRYTVSYNWNGGFGAAQNPDIYTVGSSAISLPTGAGYTRDGYIFDGWATSDGGVKLPANFTPTSDVLLFARWIDGAYTLNFDSTGGTLSSSSVSVTRATTTVLPTPVRAGFQFQGWFKDAATTLAFGQGGSTITPTSSGTVYAKWVQNSLAGINPAHLNSLTTITTQNGVDSSWTGTHTNSGTGAELIIPANALPAGTNAQVSFVEDLSRPANLIDNNFAYFTSVVVHWLQGSGSSATVPEAISSTPLTLTLTNPAIVAGAKVFKIINGVATEVATATIDGEVVLTFTEDPEFVVAATRPSTPRTVSATDGEDAASTVSWTAPAGNGGSVITNYTVTASPGGATCLSSSTTCSFTGLTNGVDYTFSVSATNAIGTSSSAASPAITPRAAVIVTPPAPAPIPGTNNSSNSSNSNQSSNGSSSRSSIPAQTNYTVTPDNESAPATPYANSKQDNTSTAESTSTVQSTSNTSGQQVFVIVLLSVLAVLFVLVLLIWIITSRRRKR